MDFTDNRLVAPGSLSFKNRFSFFLSYNISLFWYVQSLNEANEKISAQQKELKEAQNQRKLAMAEFSELNDKLADMRSQKTKLSRTVREKEEELGTFLRP